MDEGEEEICGRVLGNGVWMEEGKDEGHWKAMGALQLGLRISSHCIEFIQSFFSLGEGVHGSNTGVVAVVAVGALQVVMAAMVVVVVVREVRSVMTPLMQSGQT